MTCTGPDCERPSARQGLCWAHHKQRRAGRSLRPLRPWGADAWSRLEGAAVDLGNLRRELLEQAADELADADTDAEYERARDRLRKAAVAYVTSLPSAGKSTQAA